MGVFQQVWEVYKEGGCEVTVHKTIASQLGTRSDGSESAAVRSFMTEMERYLTDPEMLLLLLSVGLGSIFESQSSFVGILLREDVLQSPLIDFLLEKLSELAHMEHETTQMMERNAPKLILREIRWIDHVVDSKELVEKLISAMPAFPVALQRDIIYILPEIARDEDSHMVIDALLELIRSEAELVVCCIEALGNFNVLTEQTSEVVGCILERLDSSPLTDLPAIVKYLVQEAPATDVSLIVNELREKLSATLSFSETNQPRRGGNEESLILGSIAQGFYFREELMKTFVSSINKSDADGCSGLRLLDVWVLAAGHSIIRDRAKIEQIVKRKVTNGQLTPRLVIDSIKGHANALKSYFSSLLHVASMLLGQTNQTCVSMGSLLYELLFEEFSRSRDDGRGQIALYQGEIISSLLGHCFSTTRDITDAALDTFVALTSDDISFRENVQRNDYELTPVKRRLRFHVFLPVMKQLLDTTETGSAGHIRKVYDILFAVAGAEDAELCNLLRKQAFHQELRYRQFGIIGAVSRMNQLLHSFREAALSEDERVPDTDVARTLNRCNLELFENSSSNGACVSFLLEELSRWVDGMKLDKYSNLMLGIISEFYMEVLSSRFMDDYDHRKYLEGGYKKPVLGRTMNADLWMCLDVQQCPVYLKIFDLALSANVAERDSLLYLNTLAELVLTCARRNNQVTEINCVLICPIQMMERSVIEDIAGLDHSAQNIVCITLWHSINWIRTLLSFFSAEPDNYYVNKVVERLKNLAHIEAILLEEALHACPTFAPPGTEMSSTKQAAKTLNTEKKKPGRPSKNAQAVNRPALVRQSFLPLKQPALKILTFPALWNEVITESSAAPQSGPAADQLVRFLLLKLETQLETTQSSMKGKFSFQRTDGSMVIVPNTAVEVIEAGVFQSCCMYAQYYLQQYKTESEKEDDADEDRLDMASEILQVYLRIAVGVFNSGNSNSEQLDLIQLCQDFFLPKEQHIELSSGEAELKTQILESCFHSSLEFSCIVKDSLSTAGVFIQSLQTILSLEFGFAPDQLLAQSREVSFRPNNSITAVATMNNKIAQLALSYLQHDWSGGDKKYVYKPSELEIILRGYLHHGSIVLDQVQTLGLHGILELLENGGTEIAAFPTLGKKTMGIYHRVMFDTLVAATSRLDFDEDKNNVPLLLNYLTQSVLLFKLLVAITKSYQKSVIVATVLKKGRKYVEIILQAMPFLQAHFLDHNDMIMKLISEVQVATRRMQVLCAHGKLIKDATAAAQVPMVKKLLERFIYRGEELARAHGLLDAYTTGVLKNRRIDGTTISKEELEATHEESSESEAETEQGGSSETEGEEENAANEDAEEKEEGDGANHHPRKRQR